MEIYAYKLDTCNIKYCYELQEDIVVFDSGRKGFDKRVKQKLWAAIEDFGLRDDVSSRLIKEEDVEFLRAPRQDKRMYKGKFVGRGKYNGILKERRHNKHIQAILDNESITHCHIMKRGDYYGDNYGGYTSSYHFAGVYPKEDAAKHAKGILEIYLSPINNEEHNDRINQAINKLKSHLIKKGDNE